MAKLKDYYRQYAEKKAEREKRRGETWRAKLKDPLIIFTGILALSTVALTIVACLQLAALSSTDKATHDLAKAALNQAEDMRAQIRANVASEGLKIEPFIINGVNGWNINPMWKNGGGTDAVNFRHWWNLDFVESPPDKEWGPTDCPKPPDPMPLSGGGRIPRSGGIVEIAQFLTPEIVQRAYNREGAIFAVGYNEYASVFPSDPILKNEWCVMAIPNDPAHHRFSFINIR